MFKLTDIHPSQLKSQFFDERAEEALFTTAYMENRRELEVKQRGQDRYERKLHLKRLMQRREQRRIDNMPVQRHPQQGHRLVGAVVAEAFSKGKTFENLMNAEITLHKLGFSRSALIRQLLGKLTDVDVVQRIKQERDKREQLWFSSDLPLTMQALHNVHQSETDALMVAYTPSVAYLMQDRQIKLKPGRYLAKFYGHLTESQQKALVEQYLAEHTPVEIKIATTEDDIVRAINLGPSESCQSAGFYGDRENWYKGHKHPAACFAGSGDIEVLYMEDGDGDVVGRVIANAKTKKCARIYGDVDKMEKAIAALGYTQARGALVGCRLRKIENEHDGGYLMPYVDGGTRSGGGALYAMDRGDWWVLNDSGRGIYTYNAGYESRGVTACTTCDHCGDACDDDDMTRVHNDDMVCERCRERYFQWCEEQGEYYPESDCIYCESNDYYYSSERAAHRYSVYQCAESGDWYNERDMVSLYNGDMVHEDLAVEIGDNYYLKSECPHTDLVGWVCDEDVAQCDFTGKSCNQHNMVEVGDHNFHNSVIEEYGGEEETPAAYNELKGIVATPPPRHETEERSAA